MVIEQTLMRRYPESVSRNVAWFTENLDKKIISPSKFTMAFKEFSF